jgi:protein-S-isoprenylcysteine O-methyltransferase Ste14
MSREERRQYQRMMRNAERGPALPPAARARAERNAARRARRKQEEAASGTFTRRWLIRTLIFAFLVGFIAFSLQWPEMPRALYVGTAVGLVVVGLLAGFRLVRRRFAPPAS